MDVKLLGPVEIHSAGRSVGPLEPRQRAVLAALAVDVGQPVLVDTLVDRVWGETAPRQVRQALYKYVSQLRKAIAGAGGGSGSTAPLLRRSGGYVLDLDPDSIDIHRFRRLVASARGHAGQPPYRVEFLRRATQLWRGIPLADLAGDWAARVRTGWQHEYVDAVTAWARAELDAGDVDRALGRLVTLVGDHPLNESLAAVLMAVLHAAGRSAEALDHYARIRRHLAEDLGTEPGLELRGMYQTVLRGEPSRTTAPAPVPATTRASPAQLPADVHGFTGRRAELAHLHGLLAGARPPAVLITALAGTAGVGKTALAVHWSHQVRSRFPDGQLYVNLRGFDPTGSAMTPTEAIRRFLDALHVLPHRVPADLDAQAALYRTLLAGKRILVVLDNARDADQVRPLLPGSPGCLIVITSRSRLPSLVAAEGFHPVPLDLLTDDEARDLLTRRLGAARMAAEPAAVDEIIRQCAGLPLALAIAAANVGTHPGQPIAALSAQLRRTSDRLSELSTGDAPTTDLRTVFSWSYDALDAATARLFRLLGLHPGPDIPTAAAASLAAVPTDRATSMLTELGHAHLVVEAAAGRYVLHDLLRAFAAELSRRTDPEAQRRAAIRRLLDHYLRTAYAAARAIEPHQEQMDLPPAVAGVVTEDVAEEPRASAWFATEHPALVALVTLAADTRLDTHAWQLAWTLTDHFLRRGHWREWAAANRTAVKAAQRLGDFRAHARAEHGLAYALGRLGRFDEATAHYLRAQRGYRRTGDHIGQARAHRGLAWLHEQRGRYRDALDHARQALELHRSVDNRPGHAGALNAVGWYHARLGQHRQAIKYCQQALHMQRALGDKHGEAATWDSLGYALHHLGSRQRAGACYDRALRLYRQVGDRYNEADVLTHLGDNQHADGDHRAARHAWEQAVDIFQELDHPDLHTVAAKLHDLDQPAG